MRPIPGHRFRRRSPPIRPGSANARTGGRWLEDTQLERGPIDHAEATGKGGTNFVTERYPDFVTIAKGYGWGAATISQKSDLTGAIEEMINSDGPYLLNVQVPYVEHVLPMIPGGRTVDDMILE